MARYAAVLGLLFACDGNHTVEVTWSFMRVADNEPVGCPDGFASAEIHVRPVDEVIVSHGTGTHAWVERAAELHAVYDCRDGSGTTRELSPGDDDSEWEWTDLREGYAISVAITDGAGGRYSTSVPVFVDAGKLEPVHLDFVEDGGRFSFPWTRAGYFEQWSWCKGARALRINVEGSDRVDAEVIGCDLLGLGVVEDEGRLTPLTIYTRPYPAGTYRVWIDALDASWQLLADSRFPSGIRTQMWTDQVLQPHNHVLPLM